MKKILKELKLKLDDIHCAIQKLQSYDGVNPPEVKMALETHFNGYDGTIITSYLSFLFRYMSIFVPAQEYRVELNDANNTCGLTASAWSYPTLQLTPIRLCDPVYFNSLPNDQTSTIIHESFHLHYVAGDWAYDWQGAYSQLNLFQQLTNADSFSEFARDLCQ